MHAHVPTLIHTGGGLALYDRSTGACALPYARGLVLYDQHAHAHTPTRPHKPIHTGGGRRLALYDQQPADPSHGR